MATPTSVIPESKDDNSMLIYIVVLIVILVILYMLTLSESFEEKKDEKDNKDDKNKFAEKKEETRMPRIRGG